MISLKSVMPEATRPLAENSGHSELEKDAGDKSLCEVAVVAYTDYPTDSRIRLECERAVREGYAVSVIAAMPVTGPSPCEIEGVRIHEVPLKLIRGGKARYIYQYLTFLALSTIALARLNRRRQFKVIHVHTLPDFQVLSALFFKFRRIPVIIDLHEALPEIVAARFDLTPGSMWVKLAAFAEQMSCRLADYVVAASDGIRDAVIGRGIAPDRVTAIYNSAVSAHGGGNPDLSTRASDFPAGFVLVHAGGINPERDLETLVKALALLAPHFNVKLILAGPGDAAYVDSITSLADSLGISDRVRYVGMLPLVAAQELMSTSSVGLVTAVDNPLARLAWPTRLVEYAALSKPLLVPDLPFIRRKVGNRAVYYRPGDEGSLAEALRILLETHRSDTDRAAESRSLYEEVEASSIDSRLPELYRRVRQARELESER